MHMRCDVQAVASLCTAITMSGSATAWWVRSMRSGSGASVEKIKIGSVREVCGPG